MSSLRGDKDPESELRSRGYTEEMITGLKKARISEEIHTMGLKFTVPLTRFRYPYLSYIVTLLENYERGVLPFPGTISEQPAQIIEILNVVKMLRDEYQLQQQKKHQESLFQNSKR